MSTHPNPIPTSTDERFHQLEQQMAETRGALQTQSEQIDKILKLLTPVASVDAQAERTDGAPVREQIASFVSRRSMLKQAALASLGAAAVLEMMPSARAATGDNLVLGQPNSASGPTNLVSSSGTYSLYVANTNTGSTSNYVSILANFQGTGTGAAVFGNSNTASGSGVYGANVTGTGVTGTSQAGNGVFGQAKATTATVSGVYGSASAGFGVKGVSTSGDGLYGSSGSGYGVYGVSTTNAGVSGFSSINQGVFGLSDSGSGVYGATNSNGIGVYGKSDTGTALVGRSRDNYGASLSGGVAPLIFVANSLANPYLDTVAHMAGELYVTSTDELWYCTASGTPGTWRKLAGNATAGSFALLSAPTRFIDTRTPMESPSSTGTAPPPPGASVTTYIFTGTNALVPYTPMGSTAPVIPYGATGLVGRITVLSGENGNTAAGGRLMVSNVNPPGFGSGLVLWQSGAESQVLPFVLALDNATVAGSGQLYFENNSNDVIDIVVDVTGYYY